MTARCAQDVHAGAEAKKVMVGADLQSEHRRCHSSALSNQLLQKLEGGS